MRIAERFEYISRCTIAVSLKQKGAAPFGTAPRPAARSARRDVHEVSRGECCGFKADLVGSLARLRITEQVTSGRDAVAPLPAGGGRARGN